MHDKSPARRALFIYSGVTITLGVVTTLWGPAWTFLGTDSPGAPFVHAALVRIAGTVLVALGLSALAIARSAEALALPGAIGWFGFGHLLLAMVLMTQRDAILGPTLASRATGLTMTLFLILMYVREAAVGTDLGIRRGTSATASVIHSRYDQAIREAASQEERHRLARDLHDSIKQQIFAIQTAGATAEARLSDDQSGVDEALALVRSSAREAMTEMEAMLDQLRAAPLDNAGLVAAVRKQCEALGFRTGATVTFSAGELPPDSALGPGTRPTVLRVAQEALGNVARHARAGHVTVALGATHDDLNLTVTDDGAGFDRGGTGAGMGLRNMESRAGDVDGRLAITSAPGRGTTVSLTIPALAAHADVAMDRWRPWNNTIIVWAAALLIAELWPGKPYTVAIVVAATWTFSRDRIRRHVLRKAAA